MEEVAYAKLNLALHVRSREPDDYHRIETLFAFAADGDHLAAEPSSNLSLNASGPFAEALGPPEDNLVLRAARELQARYRVTRGAALRLEKRLPIASGIGGGSADAAAALRLLNRFWDVGATEAELLSLAAGLGADVPACVLSRPSRGVGRGDELQLLGDELGGTPLLLANPGIAVPTGPVFQAWNGRDLGALPPGELLASAIAGRNDLEAPAIALAPEIGDVLAALSHCPGTMLVRMSGSGATCFALFDSMAARDDAYSDLSDLHPHWWLLASTIRQA